MAQSTFRENFLRVVAVIGLIAILLLGAWGIIQLAFYLPTLFKGVGQAKEAITLTVPAQTTSDKGFTASWKHTAQKGEQSYSLSYTCAAGLQFAAPVPTGALQLVPCNTPFNYVSASSSMALVPVLAKGTSQASTTFTVVATTLATGATGLRATDSTVVVAATAPVTTPTTPAAGVEPASSKPSSTYVPSGRTQNLYGSADLAVQITSAPQSVSAGQRITLQFVVTNVGTNVAPAGWAFVASLPYTPVYTFPSGSQQALYPGDKIVYTLGYDAVRAGAYGPAQVSIHADSGNAVQEQDEQNNTAGASYQVY
jgi:hypothetical protein